MGGPPVESGAMPRIAEGVSAGRGTFRHRRFAWLRNRLHASEPLPVLRRPVAPPSVVLACERCGFDYTVTRIEVGAREKALLWTCSCGSRFIPPGGVPSFQLVRP